MFLDKSCVCFECCADFCFSGVQFALFLCARLEVFFDVDDFIVFVEKDNVKWNVCVLHPECFFFCGREEKEHAVVFW